jgi:hypothetical protein
MATLQSIKSIFYIRYRLGDRPYRRSLGITSREDAEDTRKQVEVSLYRIKVNLIQLPPPVEDVPLFPQRLEQPLATVRLRL